MSETVGKKPNWPGALRRIVVWSAIAALLLLPLIAMQFTDEVAWTGDDFAFAGVVLVGAGLVYEFVSWKITSPRLRLAMGVVILAAVLLIWVEGAVGIFH